MRDYLTAPQPTASAVFSSSCSVHSPSLPNQRTSRCSSPSVQDETAAMDDGNVCLSTDRLIIVLATSEHISSNALTEPYRDSQDAALVPSCSDSSPHQVNPLNGQLQSCEYGISCHQHQEQDQNPRDQLWGMNCRQTQEANQLVVQPGFSLKLGQDRAHMGTITSKHRRKNTPCQYLI